MITLAQYRGKSCVSWAIRKQTRSIWSHTAAVLRDNSVVEAWHRGGVSHVDNLSANHSPGTIVDLFSIECTKTQADDFEFFLRSQVGMPYDFRSVWRFISKKEALENGKWFCSELFFYGVNMVSIRLLDNIRPSEVSPQLLGISPVPKPIGKIITGKSYDSEFLYNQS